MAGAGKGESGRQQACCGGIAGRKEGGGIISSSDFDRQMLKRTIAYYDGGSKSKAGDPASEGLLGSELVKPSLPGVLDAAHWTAHEGFYPVLRAFDGKDEGVLGSAAVVFTPHDLLNRLGLYFTLSTGGSFTWSAAPAHTALSGTSVQPQTGRMAVRNP
ncbi:hypothetical protein AMQ83_07520, partial [Paenibacillus riograndensis]